MWPFRRRVEFEDETVPVKPPAWEAALIHGSSRALSYNIGPREEEWRGEPVPPDRLVNEALRHYETVKKVKEAMAVIDRAEEERKQARERAAELANFARLLRSVGVDATPTENPAQIAGLWFERHAERFWPGDSAWLYELRCGVAVCPTCHHVIGQMVTALSDIGSILAGEGKPTPHDHSTDPGLSRTPGCQCVGCKCGEDADASETV